MVNARHFLISGVVQGVYYRLSTQQQAQRLGVSGWVRNLTDGRVEVLAIGPPRVLALLERWLWQGPERACVSAIVAAEVRVPELQGFEKRETAAITELFN